MWRGFNKPRFKEENNYLLALDPDNKRRIDYFVFANKPIDQWNLDHLFFTIITCFLNFRSLVCTDEKCNLVRYFKSDIFITRYFLFHLVHFIFYISNTRAPKIINWDRFNWSLLAVCVSHAIQSVQSVTCLTNSGHFCVITSLSEGAAKDPVQRSGWPKKPGHI